MRQNEQAKFSVQWGSSLQAKFSVQWGSSLRGRGSKGRKVKHVLLAVCIMCEVGRVHTVGFLPEMEATVIWESTNDGSRF
jgi:hypothetical protein